MIVVLSEKMKKVVNVLSVIAQLVIGAAFFYYFCFMQTPKQNPLLKDYKDGIQNHLTWNIKGECFFVRPNDDVTVYLIRVNDCDKK
jgi:uncharacterized protein YxeA